jgi:putative aminopeptidase FrvX
MNKRRTLSILQEVLSLPTAPFAERYVQQYIRTFVGDRPNIKLKTDSVGNLLLHYRRGSKRIDRPVCLTAHMDHPGFRAGRMLDDVTLRAHWHGGVPAECFSDNKVKFFNGDRWIKGRIASVDTGGRGSKVVKTVTVRVKEPVAAECPGMWDLPDPVIRSGCIHARACDDLAGAAAMLACADDLQRRNVAGEAYFLFTRAEEVGFVGAMAAAKLKTVPKRCVVVAVETSSQRPNARIGDGPILRVGDKRTTFTSAATSFCAGVADDLVGAGKSFVYQRKLMDGGTCESTAYCQLGYDATGICIALGNYHNVHDRTRAIRPEYVSVDDYTRLARWFVALVETKRRYTGRHDELKAMLGKLEKRYASLLKRTARATT